MARIGLTTNQAGNMMDQSEGVMSKAPTERAIFAPSLRYLLALPYQILLTISDFLDLSTSSRQIIRITPRSPGQLKDGRTIAEWADKYVPSLRGSCDLTRWLPNGHLQTVYSVIGDFSKVDEVRYARYLANKMALGADKDRTYLRVPDGGTLGLDFTPPHHEDLPDSTPTIVICHGLTGGSHESYVRNVLSWVVKPEKEGGLGARAVVINFRGCAGIPLTSSQFYSAGTTLDLALSLHYLRSRYPRSPLHGLGFSLGASVLSRYLGETGPSSLLSSGIAIGTPWDLPAMSITLENHWFKSRVYSRSMGTNLLRLFFKHYDRNSGVFWDVEDSVEGLRGMRGRGVTLKGVDEWMVSKVGGPRGIGLWPFGSADEYYEWASPKTVLQGVKRPLLAINAFDDPIIDNSATPIDEIQSSSHVYLAVTPGGGHLGWFTNLTTKDRWVRKPISEFLIAATRDLPIKDAVIEVEEKDGWEWLVEAAHEVSGVGGEDGRVGWRVLREGEVVEGSEGSGAMQGL